MGKLFGRCSCLVVKREASCLVVTVVRLLRDGQVVWSLLAYFYCFLLNFISVFVLKALA